MWIPARWYTKVTGVRQVDLIVLHCTQTVEMGSTARGVATFFSTIKDQAAGASAHSTADDKEHVESVDDNDVAWGANGVNHNGWHLEQIGFANQSAAEWNDDYSLRMIRDVVAPLVAEKCRKFGIPPVFLKADELLLGHRGITTHFEAEKAWPKYGHTDPGVNYPMAFLLSEVAKNLASGGHATPTPISEDDDEMRQFVMDVPWMEANPNGTDPFFVVSEVEGEPNAFTVASLNNAPHSPAWEDGKDGGYYTDFVYLGMWCRKFHNTTGRPFVGGIVRADRLAVPCEGGGTYGIAHQ